MKNSSTMIITFTLVAGFLFLTGSVTAQDDEILKKQLQFSEQVTGYFEGDMLLTMAEKFATIGARSTQSLAANPSRRLKSAREAEIFPDQGWGGKNGQITDNLFRRKFEFARSEASQILENATRSLASRVQTGQ